ncbi:MAG: divergent polysaccharide deacetylase family protein [Deltaproteobacteria bacterium]|nr:divergent polysaccharide deacetylase family protein [Deltaproteobacteria bacterium]
MPWYRRERSTLLRLLFLLAVLSGLLALSWWWGQTARSRQLASLSPLRPQPSSLPAVLPMPPRLPAVSSRQIALPAAAQTAEKLRRDLHAALAVWADVPFPEETLHSEPHPGRQELIRVYADFPSRAWIKGLKRRLQKETPDVRLRIQHAPRALEVTSAQAGTSFLVFFLPPASPSGKNLAGKPLAAVIMDDMGHSREVAQAVMELPLPVTLAIIPDEKHAEWTARLARQRGREILAHVPMQPLGKANPGVRALRTDISDQENLARLRWHLQRVPGAAGVNNHMGSRFTADGQRMALVLAELRRHGLFFVDSRTSGSSVGYRTARNLGVASTGRDVFLDNERQVGKILGQIDALLAKAGKQGSAVAICHPYPETLAALRQAAPRFRARGVELVPVRLLLDK